MPLVDSLLTAIVRSDGDALVLHVGEKPYVVAAAGSVELSRQGLGLGAMEGLLAQLLTAEALRSLREMGAVEHELTAVPAAGGDRFTVVAARGGDDIWIEVRRHRRVRHRLPVPVPAPELVAPEPPPTPAEHTPAPEPTADPVEAAPPEMPAEAPAPALVAEPEPAPVEEVAAPVPEPIEVLEPVAEPPVPAEPVVEEVEMPEPVPVVEEPRQEAPPEPAPFWQPTPEPGQPDDLAPWTFAPDEPEVEFELPELPGAALYGDLPSEAIDHEVAKAEAPAPESALETPHVEPVVPAPAPVEPAKAVPPPVMSTPEPPPIVVTRVPDAIAVPPAPEPVAAPVVRIAAPVPARAVPSLPERRPSLHQEPPVVAPPPSSVRSSRLDMAPEPAAYAPDPQPTLPGLPHSAYNPDAPVEHGLPDESADALPGVVLSLTRESARTGGAARGGVRPGGIERLLRLASARGASALYLTTQARPAVRVDGDIRLLEGEAALSSGDVEAAVLELAPEGARDKESAEWIRDLQDVGRVRITTFRDYRGPGALLRMISARATSAEQLGLVREIQALATEPEGLVIVTGPRASGKSTLVSAFVDLINRQRNDYVITLEGQIRLVHESRGSLISQRELRGSAGEIVAAARAALRENPDVMVIEDLRSPDVLQVALDAAGSGLLVFVSVTAASATAALERLVDLCPSEQRRTVRAALAEHLRGVVAQVLLRKAGGGRLAARELVLNTNAVAALVSDGQIAQLPRAIDSGRKLGMAPLNDALVAFVQSGAVDVREAYRKADDKAGLLALLRREGIDTSFVERLA